MRNAILSLAAAAAVIAALPGMANAEVIERIGPAPVYVAPVRAPVVPVRYYCAPGFHIDRWGHCRPNYRYAPPPPPPVHHWRRCFTRWTPYGWRRFCRAY